MSVRTGVILALVATFLIGCSVGAIGGFATAGYVARHLGPPRNVGGPGRPGMEPRPMLHMLERRLDLSDEQVGRIDAILTRSHARMDGLRDSTHAELERVLTPAQRREWRRMEERLLRFGRGAGGGMRFGRGRTEMEHEPPPGP